MQPNYRLSWILICSWGLAVWSGPAIAGAAEPDTVGFQLQDSRLDIKVGSQTIAEYVWKDEQVARPYFRQVRTRSGIQVTRQHPPIKGQDIDDHPTMHPGLWLALGDINGVDFWRNKGQVRHVEFVEQPKAEAGRGSFAVKNSYEHDGKVIATEVCRIRIETLDAGYAIHWGSTFRSDDSPLTFGDQEEMGLGVRLATPLAVAKGLGGQILDSEQRRNGAEVWGKQADWCEYGGKLDGHRVGIVLMPGPHNFRKSWFHARDYGLLVANPFGRQAFTKGEPSQVVTPARKDFSLSFDVLVYDVPSDQPLDIKAVYQSVVSAQGR